MNISVRPMDASMSDVFKEINKNVSVYPAIGIDRHRIQTDGVGVTTLAASYGCPLRCAYCINSYCFQSKTIVRKYTAEQLLKELMIDDLYFQATGGGVTFGGGEPLLQAGFLHHLISLFPQEWHVSMETSLNVPEFLLKTVIDDIDEFFVDIKDMNPEIYQSYTGKNNDHVIHNLDYLVQNGYADRVTIRLPLIPEYNTINDVDMSEARLREKGFQKFDRFTYRIIRRNEEI